MNVLLDYNDKPVYYIDNELNFGKAVHNIETCAQFCVDTEFDKNRNSFGFNLCVIQVATPECIYLIDPVSITSRENYSKVIKPFFELVASPDIQKIMHACTEDIRLFAKYGFYAQNVFDTKIAARVLGYETADSYKGMLKAILNVELDKSQQSINWLKRPLRSKDMTYLAGDVYYLFELQKQLNIELLNSSRITWFEEETMLTLSFDRDTDFDYDISNTRSKLDFRMLSPFHKALFEGIWDFRGEYAKSLNVPPYYIFTDENIYELIKVEHWNMDTPLNVGFKRLATYDKQIWLNFIRQLRKELDTKNLSKEAPPKKIYSHEEKIENTHKQYQTLKHFSTIQDYLNQKYGETIGRVLLSKTTIGKISSAGNIQFLPSYVQKEIISAASATESDITMYF